MTTAALTGPDEQRFTESERDVKPERDVPVRRHPLDQLIPDPSGLTPVSDEPGFTAIMERMAADQAPRLFAIVQEYGERVDGRIAAWGMAFDDHTEVVSTTGGTRGSLRTPEHALRMFTIGSHIHARLVWVNPDAATPPQDDKDPD